MIRRSFAIALTTLLAGATAARGQGDFYRVHLLSGQAVSGRLGEVSRNKVVLTTSTGSKELNVNEIKYLQIPGEPRELMEARNSVIDGKYSQALEWLNKIPPPQYAKEAVKQDADFYRALAGARLAINRVGDAKAAGTALVTFLNANKESYHFYEANEATGDLLVALSRYDQAPAYYNVVASAPWPEYKMRAAVATGRALQAQGKHDEAIKQFETAGNMEADGKRTEAQLLATKVGKAKSLVELGRSKEGIELLKEVVAQAPGDFNELQSLAYNTLGGAYVKAKQPNDALFAYLHVDVLYNQSPDAHAEALYHLKQLWRQLNKPQKSQQAADTLKSRYATSQWNK